MIIFTIKTHDYLAHSATHAVVFAQLYTEGKCQGLHSFVIQVRDMKTMKSLPGIAIGDMGEKPGDWNGVENGWMKFDVSTRESHFRKPTLNLAPSSPLVDVAEQGL